MKNECVSPLAAGLSPRMEVLKLHLSGVMSEITALILPNDLRTTNPNISATVCWEGIDALASFVKCREAETDPWSRCIQLLWATVSPDTLPQECRASFMDWRRVIVTVPEMSAGLGDSRVQVVLERGDWSATFSRVGQAQHVRRLRIPEHLRTADAGSLAVDTLSWFVGRAG